MSRRRTRFGTAFVPQIRPGRSIPRLTRWLLLGAWLFAACSAVAELAPRFQWAQAVATGRAVLSGLAVDDAHHSHVMGWIVGTPGAVAVAPSTNFSTFIAEYDAAGRQVRVVKDGDRMAEGRILAVDGSGNLYVAYALSGPARIAGRRFPGLAAVRPGLAAVLAKYDPVGRPLWAKLEPGPGVELIADLAVDRAGNCCWVLRLTGDRSIVTKYDPAGNPVWSHGAGGTARFRAVAMDELGHAYVSGGFSGELRSGNIRLVSNETALGLRHIFLIKMSATGEALWGRQSDGSRWEGTERIAVDAAGHCVMFGEFEGDASFGATTLKPASPGFAARFAARYDPDGNMLWAQLVGVGDGSGPKTIAVDAGGNAYLAWLPGRAARAEVMLAKYEPSGRNAWTRNGPVLSRFSLAADSAGYVYLAGAFRDNTASFDSLVVDNQGDPSRSPGICLGMLDTTSPPWQGLVNGGPKPKSKGPATFYMGPVQGFHPTNTAADSQPERR